MDREIQEMFKEYSIPAYECGSKAFEVAGIMKGKKVDPFPGVRYPDKEGLLIDIDAAIRSGKIVIIWFYTVRDEYSHDNYHCYFIYGIEPLRGFSLFHNKLGPDLFDEEQLLSSIENTMKYVLVDGGVEIHVIE
jgi:hypothetical protein